MQPLSESDLPGRSISELLGEFAAQNSSEHHDVGHYAREFERLRPRAERILRVGRNCVTFGLCDGTVLKLTYTRELAPGMGERPFEMPILSRRKWPRPHFRDIIYFIQPRATTPITNEQFTEFSANLAKRNYRFVDPRSENVGVYRGRLTLLDPWAVCCPRPLSELLREVTDRNIHDAHDIYHYAQAFATSPFRAWRILGAGGESVVFELNDGNILKVAGNRNFDSQTGRRPFDVPILDQGRQALPERQPMRGPTRGKGRKWEQTRPVDPGFLYFVQPRVETPVTREQMKEFWDRVRASGYRFVDPSPENLGIYQGQVLLLDPWAVSR